MHNNIPQAKPHFEVLDGLRGLAALSIVIFHLYEFIIPDYTLSPIGHGYLAVDFFFCLSGFVIGYAYDERASQMGIMKFFRNRFIRLHPMVVWGSVIGLLGYIFDPFTGIAMVAEAGWGKIILAFVSSLFLIPFPLLPGRFNGLFPLNTPAWSLFMEYIINIFYGLVLLRLPKRWLLVFLATSVVCLMAVARERGWIITGWDAPTFFDGFARVGFSFLAGLVIFRFRLIIQHRLNFLFLAALLLGVFIFPHRDKDWLTEMLLVIVVLPLIVSLGAGATVRGPLKRFCTFTGRLSYPLYMTHIWAIWIFGNYLNKIKPDQAMIYWAATGVFIGSCLLAWLVLRFYDEPVRAWLAKKWSTRE
ncbi:acyltransferase family protein [Chitinophaga barathri]|uniref:Acyltransferase n=1 Tax=Chitinophaga barathri TaxID=1647451 RepID=A0A3N4MDC8_9BACT|nr:acyltransferase [Chitinophaga barathri]RPD39577.1 acyltransferase [Chitinophaga barathri]